MTSLSECSGVFAQAAGVPAFGLAANSSTYTKGNAAGAPVSSQWYSAGPSRYGWPVLPQVPRPLLAQPLIWISCGVPTKVFGSFISNRPMDRPPQLLLSPLA